MRKNIEILNDLLVDIFDSTMMIEERELKKGRCGDLSITEFHTLAAIGLDRSRTMSEAAKDLKITVGTLTTAINRLVKKGYVDRRREESDRRIVKIFLTNKGVIAYKEHDHFHEAMVEAMVKDLTLENQQLIIESLTSVKKFLDLKTKGS